MLARPRWISWVCASLAVALLASGCNRGPKLGPVTGIVTLDNEPLADAQVEFQPTGGGGAPSYGTTNALGQYELKYTKDKPGAVVGSHVVRITTQTTVIDPETGEEKQIPQRVPEKYNYRSELVRQVTPEPNTIDFDLESEPEVEPPPEEKPKEEKPKEKEPDEKKPEEEQPDAEGPATEKPAAEPPQPEKPGDKPAGTQRGEVSGRVTFNGKPMVGAAVEFRPQQGPALRTTTDENGRYELIGPDGEKGTVEGMYLVRITAADSPPVDPQTEKADEASLVPAKYHAESELAVQVGAGRNTFNFDLEG
jgi:hypothetical protein